MKPYFDKTPKEIKIKGKWLLTLEEFRFYCSKNFYILIPKYILSDGPSIPPCCMWAVQREDIYFSGIAHDFCRDVFFLSNRGIDGIFYDMCRAEGAPIHKSLLAYLGVRLGSYLGFKSSPTQEIIQKAKQIIQFEENIYNQDKIFYQEKFSRFKILP